MDRKVAFTAMDHGSREDYDLVEAHDAMNAAGLGGRVLGWLRSMDGDSPYRVSRLEHALQTATRAERDGADDETIACALLHDIGDVIAPRNHSEAAAAVLAPYVSGRNHWIVRHHGLFQGYYWLQHYGRDRNGPRPLPRPRTHEACIEFCASLGPGVVRSDYGRIRSNITSRWCESCSPARRGRSSERVSCLYALCACAGTGPRHHEALFLFRRRPTTARSRRSSSTSVCPSRSTRWGSANRRTGPRPTGA